MRSVNFMKKTLWSSEIVHGTGLELLKMAALIFMMWNEFGATFKVIALKIFGTES